MSQASAECLRLEIDLRTGALWHIAHTVRPAHPEPDLPEELTSLAAHAMRSALLQLEIVESLPADLRKSPEHSARAKAQPKRTDGRKPWKKNDANN